MKIKEWIRGIGGIVAPLPNASVFRHSTPHGNAIDPEWHSQWLPDECGMHETRCHVGRSKEGFHAGIEVCRREGMGRIEWHEAQPSPEKAQAESTQLQNACREKIPCCIGGTPSGCCLYSTADAGVAMALLELHEIVAKIENDPARNWPRYHPDFDRAVVGLSRSITALWVRQGQALERGGER
jgi:hypothetical protein